MGTDIHGVWQKRDGVRWIDIASNYTQDRHYLLFAWLGNVRNGFGFAGVKTHEPIPPLSDSRGFPSDFVVDEEGTHPITSKDIFDPRRAKWHEEGEPLQIWMGDHSFSWVTSTEILAAEPPKTVRTGVITLEQYRSWDGTSPPSEWCGMISGPEIVVSEPDTLNRKTTHVRVTWMDYALESLRYFLDEVKRLHTKHGEVRFVFGFDS